MEGPSSKPVFCHALQRLVESRKGDKRWWAPTEGKDSTTSSTSTQSDIMSDIIYSQDSPTSNVSKDEACHKEIEEVKVVPASLKADYRFPGISMTAFSVFIRLTLNFTLFWMQKPRMNYRHTLHLTHKAPMRSHPRIWMKFS